MCVHRGKIWHLSFELGNHAPEGLHIVSKERVLKWLGRMSGQVCVSWSHSVVWAILTLSAFWLQWGEELCSGTCPWCPRLTTGSPSQSKPTTHWSLWNGKLKEVCLCGSGNTSGWQRRHWLIIIQATYNRLGHLHYCGSSLLPLKCFNNLVVRHHGSLFPVRIPELQVR